MDSVPPPGAVALDPLHISTGRRLDVPEEYGREAFRLDPIEIVLMSPDHMHNSP